MTNITNMTDEQLDTFLATTDRVRAAYKASDRYTDVSAFTVTERRQLACLLGEWTETGASAATMAWIYA